MGVDALLEVGAQCQRGYLWCAAALAQERDTPKRLWTLGNPQQSRDIPEAVWPTPEHGHPSEDCSLWATHAGAGTLLRSWRTLTEHRSSKKHGIVEENSLNWFAPRVILVPGLDYIQMHFIHHQHTCGSPVLFHSVLFWFFFSHLSCSHRVQYLLTFIDNYIANSEVRLN